MKGLTDNFEESHYGNIRSLDQTGQIHNKLMPNLRVFRNPGLNNGCQGIAKSKKAIACQKKLTFFCYGKSQLCDIPGEL